MKFEIDILDQAVENDPCLLKFAEALQLMMNRMVQSHFKYQKGGSLADRFPDSCAALASGDNRRKVYEETGNTEMLLDMANFSIIEFILPSHPKAHFRALPSEESPKIEWRED